jgi:hypothetical protein
MHDPGFLVTVTVTDKDAIGAIKPGDIIESSLFYKAQIEHAPGVTAEGERYDAIVRDIRPIGV